MTKKRRQFSPEKKISISREHLVEKVSVLDVCEKHELMKDRLCPSSES